MPIAFRVVSEQDYADWLAQAKKKFAAVPAASQYAEATLRH
jgi:heme/copper-type cytochrome/quinol oxidase subunit 2